MLKLVSLVIAVTVSAASAAAQLSELKIESGDAVHLFQVELADDPEEISRGLMDRLELPADHGMIFDFGAPREATMWMKNTPLPLDMLFIAPDGTVLAIAKNTVPFSERIVNPGVPVKSVLELNAGTSDALGIAPGDKVIHTVFSNTENEGGD
ncbi:MAG: DUF192 domain-containing protein [Pseudomonadota bacterium]